MKNSSSLISTFRYFWAKKFHQWKKSPQREKLTGPINQNFTLVVIFQQYCREFSYYGMRHIENK